MSNVGFEPVWVSFTTRNLTSYDKPPKNHIFEFYFTKKPILRSNLIGWCFVKTGPVFKGFGIHDEKKLNFI
jgi:hypothetical protein